jgi:hypothetical protein
MDLNLIVEFILTIRHLKPSAAWLFLFLGPLTANVAASVLGILLGGGLLRDESRIVSN